MYKNPSVDRTRHADGLVTSSIDKLFVSHSLQDELEEENPFIPSHEFVGAEMPLNAAMRQLATDDLISKGLI